MIDPLYKKPRRWPKPLGYSLIIFWGLIYIINATGDPTEPWEDTGFKERMAERSRRQPIYLPEIKVEPSMADKQSLGHHCLSSLIDGRHDGFVRLAKDKMNDPRSITSTRKYRRF